MAKSRFELDIRIESLANARLHWAAKARKVKDHRWHAYVSTVNKVAHSMLPVRITLTRIAPRSLDSDNLCSGFKALRDGIADAFGVEDNDARIDWRYAQRKGKPKQYAAEIEIETIDTEETA